MVDNAQLSRKSCNLSYWLDRRHAVAQRHAVLFQEYGRGRNVKRSLAERSSLVGLKEACEGSDAGRVVAEAHGLLRYYVPAVSVSTLSPESVRDNLRFDRKTKMTNSKSLQQFSY